MDLLTDPAEFRRWAGTLDRLTRIKAVVHDPNPGWNEDAALIRQLVEQADAERAEVVAVSRPDESLDGTAPWVEGALSQIADHGQGRLTASGNRNGERQAWDSGHQHRVVGEPEGLDEPAHIWTWMADRIRDFYGG